VKVFFQNGTECAVVKRSNEEKEKDTDLEKNLIPLLVKHHLLHISK
jgi:hypothetical protein